jgi:hypothetical protein
MAIIGLKVGEVRFLAGPRFKTRDLRVPKLGTALWIGHSTRMGKYGISALCGGAARGLRLLEETPLRRIVTLGRPAPHPST